MPTGPNLPNHGVFHRWVLDVLVVFNLITQAVLVAVVVMGRRAISVLPLAGGAVLAMFLLAYFYARWLVPPLRPRQVLLILLLKEIGVALALGLIVAVVLLIQWVF